MAYNSGALDQRVTFKRITSEPDGMGGQEKPVETVIATVWALVRPLSTKEQAAFGGIEASGVNKVVIRNHITLTEADIAVWNGKKWNIRGIPDGGTREPYLELQIERGVAL